MASAAGTKKLPFVPERSDIVCIQHDPQAPKEMKGKQTQSTLPPAPARLSMTTVPSKSLASSA